MSENGRRVIAAVREVAAERPNHVHDGDCVYVFDTKNEPGCLVGHGLWRAGLIDRAWARKHPSQNGMGIHGLEFGLDNNEAKWLRLVQVGQDNHHTWQVAVALADQWAATHAPELLLEAVMA